MVSVDYVTVGHVTVDVLPDGSRRPGGGAFYSALQAARLGRRAAIVTRGVRGEIERLLAPFADELELEVVDAEQTTTLRTRGGGVEREQELLAWAGAIARADAAIDAEIVHFAPVARETPDDFAGRARLLGVTPQGLVRSWPPGGGPIVARALDVASLPARCDAFVFSTSERESCATLLAPARERSREGSAERARQALVAVTAGAAPTELHLPDGAVVRVAVPAVEQTRDDLGAGDVFAAAFFVALAEGAAPLQATTFANAAAAVRIAGDGAGAVGGRAAIERRMALAA